MARRLKPYRKRGPYARYLGKLAKARASYARRKKVRLTIKARRWISRKIRFLVEKEGRPQKQAVAIAYSMARKRRFKVPRLSKRRRAMKRHRIQRRSYRLAKGLSRACALKRVRRLDRQDFRGFRYDRHTGVATIV